jgi:uncharacterized spore protein YtfJ
MPELLNNMLDRIGAVSSAKAVYGEPVTVHGRTIIPVARVGYGFGGGAGDGDAQGGGGGGLSTPVGVYEITTEGTRFLPLNETRKLVGALLVGFCAGMLLGRRRTERRVS